MPTTAAERVEVAVGVILDGHGRVLLGQRTEDSIHRGKWEFPGGKVKHGESRREALLRELREEVGIAVKNAYHCVSFPYDYSDRRVMLNFFVVDDYEGVPTPCEQQPLMWVAPEQLSDYDLLDANRDIVKRLKLGNFPCVDGTLE